MFDQLLASINTDAEKYAEETGLSVEVCRRAVIGAHKDVLDCISEGNVELARERDIESRIEILMEFSKGHRLTCTKVVIEAILIEHAWKNKIFNKAVSNAD